MDKQITFVTDLSGDGKPGLASPDGAIVTWWRAVEGKQWRGYCTTGPEGLPAPWTELIPVLDLAGASHGQTAAYHYVVETDVPDHGLADFNAWYETEHLPGLARVPGTIRARRYLRKTGHPRSLACYDLVSPAAMERAEWLAVRYTEWSSRVRPLFFNTRRVLYARADGS
jgi:hypothetical protein